MLIFIVIQSQTSECSCNNYEAKSDLKNALQRVYCCVNLAATASKLYTRRGGHDERSLSLQ